MIKVTKSFLIASGTLLLGSLMAATSHWFAHIEQDFRFTLLGFASAIFAGMYYGLSVEGTGSLNKSTNIA